MNIQNNRINNTKRIGIGLSFIIFPLVFIFAFATHPNLFNPHFLGPAELIQRAHNNLLLHFGHALVTLCTGLLVVVAIHFMNLLKNTPNEWFGFIGGVLAILGTLILAADKGALCLTMSALDTLPEDEFVKMMPGLLAMFGKEGWLIINLGAHFIAHWFCYSSSRFTQVQESGSVAKHIVFNWSTFYWNS